MPDFTIKFASDNKTAVIPEGENLLHAIAAADIPLEASCGGKGACSSCKALLKEGKVKLMATGKLTEEELAAGYILACQSIPESDLVIEIPE
jgi:ferredoxin